MLGYNLARLGTGRLWLIRQGRTSHSNRARNGALTGCSWGSLHPGLAAGGVARGRRARRSAFQPARAWLRVAGSASAARSVTISLMTRDLSYAAVGATRVEDADWQARPAGFRSFEATTRIGHGDEHWQAVAAAVLRWGVKTRSGFSVQAGPAEDLRVRQGQDRTLVARLGPFGLREPVRVVSVVDEPDRCGFAYGTRRGHPVSGEEAFVVHRSSDGAVWLTLRSLTRPAPGLWRVAFPVALVA